MRSVYYCVNSKTMPIVDFGPDGLIDSLEDIKNAYSIKTNIDDKQYVNYMLVDVAEIADTVIRERIGSKLEKYGIYEVGCYCVKGNYWIMQVKIDDEGFIINGVCEWNKLIGEQKLSKYVETIENVKCFDMVSYVAMAMIKEGIISEDLISSIQDEISEAVEMNVRIDEYINFQSNATV